MGPEGLRPRVRPRMSHMTFLFSNFLSGTMGLTAWGISFSSSFVFYFLFLFLFSENLSWELRGSQKKMSKNKKKSKKKCPKMSKSEKNRPRNFWKNDQNCPKNLQKSGQKFPVGAPDFRKKVVPGVRKSPKNLPRGPPKIPHELRYFDLTQVGKKTQNPKIVQIDPNWGGPGPKNLQNCPKKVGFQNSMQPTRPLPPQKPQIQV